MSGISTLDPDNFPEMPDRSLGKGHGTAALGPSDNSDSGSDVTGGPGFAVGIDEELFTGLERGTNEDSSIGHADDTAGADMGDADLDSDTDAGGTGERAAAGRDGNVRDGADIGTDSIESIDDLPLTDDDLAFMKTKPE
jgi:hypothetical protein